MNNRFLLAAPLIPIAGYLWIASTDMHIKDSLNEILTHRLTGTTTSPSLQHS